MKYLLTLFLLISLITSAQEVAVIDSLKNALTKIESAGQSNANDSLKAEILYKLSREFWSSNLDSSMLFAEQLLEHSKKTNFKRGIGNAYSSIGVNWWYKGDYENALKWNELALKTRKETGDKSAIAGSFINIGLVYDEQGNYTEALKNYLESLKLNEELGDSSMIAQCYNLIGVIYENQKNLKEALINLEKSLVIRKRSGDKWDLSESYSNLGVVYFDAGKYPEAVKNYEEALKLRLEIGDKAGIANSYNNFGDVYVKEKNYDKALESFQKAFDIYNEMGLKKNLANVTLNIAGTYQMQGRLNEAMKYGLSSLELSKEIGALDYQNDAYSLLGDIALKMNNYKDAYHYSRMHESLKDSLFNSDKTKALARLHLQYDFDKKHLADSLNFAQQKELTQLKLSRQRAFTYGGFAGLIIVAVLLFFVYRNYDRQRKTNKLLMDTQEQLVQTEKLASLGELAAGVAREIETPVSFVNNFSDLSQELIRELHDTKTAEEKKQLLDDLDSNLSKISFHGKRADKIVQSMLTQVRFGKGEKQLSDMNKICNEFVGMAYRSTLCMIPGLKVEILKKFDPQLPRINVIRQDAGRVVMNLLNNAFYAVKDKPDGKVEISTAYKNHQCEIRVRDNGKGIPKAVRQKIFEPFFTTKPSGEGTGLGLSISHDIVKAHGGELKVESKENEFTEFCFSFPA